MGRDGIDCSAVLFAVNMGNRSQNVLDVRKTFLALSQEARHARFVAYHSGRICGRDELISGVVKNRQRDDVSTQIRQHRGAA
jgi:hypothetical protein